MLKKLQKKEIVISIFIGILIIGLFKENLLLNILTTIIQILFPFLLGIAIAFIFNIPMSLIEDRFLKEKLKIKKGSRLLSYLITLSAALLLFILALFVIIPELIDTVTSIFNILPNSIEELKELLTVIFKEYPDVIEHIELITFDSAAIKNELLIAIQTSGLEYISNGFGIFSKAISTITNIFLGFIFSIYLLMQKETLINHFHLLLKALLPKESVETIKHLYLLTNETFKNFFTGQFLEAILLGIIFFITMSIFQLPYALLISIIISITALIPIFGAFAGCAIGFVLIIATTVSSAFLFLIIFLVIQQIEGNLIYPKVVGNSIGLPSIWVYVAVILGGNLFGVLGILLFIPLASIAYCLLKEYVQKKED